jgi:hypothetical protein
MVKGENAEFAGGDVKVEISNPIGGYQITPIGSLLREHG